MRLFALYLIALATVCSGKALANEALQYHSPDSYKENQVKELISKQNQSFTYVLAPVDLNGDAVDEFVVRPENPEACSDKPLCPYHIVAFKEQEPIIIGDFLAHKLLISDKKSYGIRDIIVYNQKSNDYEHVTAAWDAYYFYYR